MKTKLLVFLLMMSVCAGLAAQNSNVEKRVQLAREKYPERLNLISTVKMYERDEIPNVNYLTVVRRQNWAGSGQSVDKAEYYYSEVEKEFEPHPVGYTLMIVRRTYNVGSQDFFEEYVYDDEGNPLFWFTRYGYSKEAQIELRGYFSADGTLVRSLAKGTDDKSEIKRAFAKAKKHFGLFKKTFQSLYDVEY